MDRRNVLAVLAWPAAAAVLAAAGCANTGSLASSPVGPDKVVYHVNDTGAQAVNALRNVGNHLEVNPKAKIVIVTHALGVDFLMNGFKDKNGNPLPCRGRAVEKPGGFVRGMRDHTAQSQAEEGSVHPGSDLRALRRRRDHPPAAARRLRLFAAVARDPALPARANPGFTHAAITMFDRGGLFRRMAKQ